MHKVTATDKVLGELLHLQHGSAFERNVWLCCGMLTYVAWKLGGQLGLAVAGQRRTAAAAELGQADYNSVNWLPQH